MVRNRLWFLKYLWYRALMRIDLNREALRAATAIGVLSTMIIAVIVLLVGLRWP